MSAEDRRSKEGELDRFQAALAYAREFLQEEARWVVEQYTRGILTRDERDEALLLVYKSEQDLPTWVRQLYEEGWWD